MAKKLSKAQILKQAYTQILRSSGTDQSKVTWPEMEAGADQWYGPENSGLRKSSLAGYVNEARSSLGNNFAAGNVNVPDLGVDASSRAYSDGRNITVPDPGLQGGGYFSKPQYLASVAAHETAHNADFTRNRQANPKIVPHSQEYFRPLEQQASIVAGIEPQYNPGNDVKVGGKNEYADNYKDLKTFLMHYFVGANPQNLTRALVPVKGDTKSLAQALAKQQANFTKGANQRGSIVSNMPAHAVLD